MICLHVGSEMRSYAYGQRRRPIPKPTDWMNIEQARTIVDVRDPLRAVWSGRKLAEQIVPEATTAIVSTVPLVTHALEMLSLTSTSARSRRWVVDSGSCVDIVGGGTIANSEKRNVKEVQAPMRLDAANGEVVASKRLKFRCEHGRRPMCWS